MVNNYNLFNKEEKHFLKQQVMTNGSLHEYKSSLYQLKKFRFNNLITYENPHTGELVKFLTNEDQIIYFDIQLQLEENIAKKYSRLELTVCKKLTQSRYDQSYRIRKRIAPMVESGKSVFITLTFTDEVLNTTTAKTRAVYVARYLKSQNIEYVANIDYGEDNGREHYHAVGSNRINPTQWLYGACNVKPIKVGANSIKAIPQYISKLTNHAIKASTKRPRLIVSRVSNRIK